MKSVLVTGATGNVGSEVVRALLARGATVKATRRTAGDAPDSPGNVSARFDFGDASTYGPALDGVERVFLMRPPHMSKAKAFRPFIDAMTQSGIRQVVFLSVQGAGRNIVVPHHGIERLLKKSGLTWTILRPSFFMQNLSTTHLADIKDRDVIYVPAGRGRTNFIDVADIAEAAAACLTSPGHECRAYEITGTESLTYDEVAAVLSKACGRLITYARPSSAEFKAHMRAAGYDEDFVAVMAAIYATARFGLAAGTTDTLRTLIGREPTTLAEWAARHSGV